MDDQANIIAFECLERRHSEERAEMFNRHARERSALLAGQQQTGAEQPVDNAASTPSTPEDFVKQCVASKEFRVSRSYLYDLAVDQFKKGATWIMRKPNGHFQYSRAG